MIADLTWYGRNISTDSLRRPALTKYFRRSAEVFVLCYDDDVVFYL